MNNDQLMSLFFVEVASERKTMSKIISLIAEIDERRAYLEHECTSLTQFLIVKAGYSKSAAQRRKDAARLLRQMPELSESFETGAINLSQISQFSRLVREKEKTGKLNLEMQRELFASIKDKSTDQTEMILCQKLEITPKTVELARKQADDSVRREVTFTAEEERIFTRVRELLSHTPTSLSAN